MRTAASALIAAFLAVAAWARPGCHFVVRPDRVDSLREVAAAIAAGDFELAAKEDLHVCLEEGVHRVVGKGLQLDARHNHPAGGRVIWRPARPGASVTVSAGVPLTQWGHCDDGVHCPGEDWHYVWWHATSGLPNVSSADLPFRQLWVDGERATRTFIDGDSLKLTPTATGYMSAGPLPNSSSQWAASQTEMRWPSQIRNWIEPRCVVTNVSGGQNITMASQCWSTLKARNNNRLAPPPLFIENVPGPPGPGEFYSAVDYIFYRQPPSAPYAPPQDAWTSNLPVILESTGSVNHVFTGLSFKHATWRVPTMEGGYVPSQTLVSNHGEPTGAVRFMEAKNLSISGCGFANIGAAYALEVSNKSQIASITESTFEDCSGGAVKLGNVNDTRSVSTNPADRDGFFLLDHCVLNDISVEFRGGAAVFAGYVTDTNISHNNVTQTGYTGISIGWGWGTHVTGPSTYCTNNHITYNRLEHVMSALNDGGCVYNLGGMQTTNPAWKLSTITNNYCYSDRAPVVGSYYLDNGSTGQLVGHNVASSSPAPAVYLQGCCNSPAYNSTAEWIYANDTAPIRNECRAQHCVVQNSTIFYIKPGEPWPAGAQQIIDESGA